MLSKAFTEIQNFKQSTATPNSQLNQQSILAANHPLHNQNPFHNQAMIRQLEVDNINGMSGANIRNEDYFDMQPPFQSESRQKLDELERMALEALDEI